MTIDKNTLREFRVDFKTQMAELEKQYNIKVELGTIRFDNDTFRTKMTATNIKPGGTLTKTLSPSDIQSAKVGDTFQINHPKYPGTFTLVKKNRVKWRLKGGIRNYTSFVCPPSSLIKAK